jgi:3-deoxy-7-phosphoheptulonate synthase
MSPKEIPSPSEIKKSYPLSNEDKLFIQNKREEVYAIIEGRSPKKLLVTGPCAIHDFKGTLLFAEKLLALQKLLPNWLIVMRAHLEKPRTSKGWKGFAYDPYRNPAKPLAHGLKESRDLLVQLIQKRIPLSSELLDPFVYPYLDDCYTMAQIGTRTIRSQIHRQLAALSSFAIGLKNPQDGNMEEMVHAIQSIKTPQDFFGLNKEGKNSYLHAKGNKHLFVILRGTDQGPNFSNGHINSYLTLFHHHEVEPKFMIDCSHGNSQKSLSLQKENLLTALEQIQDPEQRILGVMVETHLKEGAQSPMGRDPGLSITDPCLSLENLTSLFLEIEEKSILKV